MPLLGIPQSRLFEWFCIICSLICFWYRLRHRFFTFYFSFIRIWSILDPFKIQWAPNGTPNRPSCANKLRKLVCGTHLCFSWPRRVKRVWREPSLFSMFHISGAMFAPSNLNGTILWQFWLYLVFYDCAENLEKHQADWLLEAQWGAKWSPKSSKWRQNDESASMERDAFSIILFFNLF